MSEIIADMILPADTLHQYVNTITSLVSEARIHFNDDGISTTVVDPANVAMIAPLKLDAAGFESYDSPGTATIGLDFVRLSERLGKAKSGDLVHLSVDMETRKLQIEYGAVEHTLAMIDPDSIRQEPDTPDIELPNRATVEASVLDEAVDHVEMVSDHFEINADLEAEELRFVGAGDIDEATFTVDHELMIEGHIGEDTSSLFSLEYVDELVSPMPAGAEVELAFGHEFPIKLDWDACDGHLTAHEAIAPRIRSD